MNNWNMEKWNISEKWKMENHGKPYGTIMVPYGTIWACAICKAGPTGERGKSIDMWQHNSIWFHMDWHGFHKKPIFCHIGTTSFLKDGLDSLVRFFRTPKTMPNWPQQLPFGAISCVIAVHGTLIVSYHRRRIHLSVAKSIPSDSIWVDMHSIK